MPWQADAARLITELSDVPCTHDHDCPGLPRYKTVVVSVPRQQGKTILSRAGIHAKAQRDASQAIYGTAQSRGYAAKHVIALGDALKAKGTDVYVRRGIGSEDVKWSNGTVYAPISPTDGGGHGDSIDWMLVDEGWALQAHVMGGVRPAMIARPHSQLLVISTMGTYDSHVWNGMVSRGRESIEDPNATMAYVEYSAPDDQAVFDEARWEEWMPALGITVTHADIRAAMEDMEPTEIVRAFGNRTVSKLVSVFPAEWVAAAWATIAPPHRMVLAVDVNDTPAGATITSAHLADDGAVALRTVEWRQGAPTWVTRTLGEIMGVREVEAIVSDFGGPAKTIRREVERLAEAKGVAFVDRKPSDLAADTLRFYGSLRDKTVHMDQATPLAEAIDGAARKNLGDMWLITRRQMTVDASPIIAAILAHGMQSELAVVPVVRPFVSWR
jgi:hypothetical protein